MVNNSGKDFADQFDGEKFDFPAQKEGAAPIATEIPVEAAALIFGLGEEDKKRCIQRLGWAATTNDMTKALERIGQFTFTLEQPKGHATAPVVDEDAASEPQGPAAALNHASDVAELAPPPAGGASLLQKLARAGARPAG